MKSTLAQLSLLGLAAIVLPSSARAAEAPGPAEGTRIAFADPSKPGTLQITLAVGHLTVHGTDGAEIEVRSGVPPRPERRADGLRVLSTSSGFTVQHHENVISLDFSAGMGAGRPARVDIALPRKTALVVNTISGNVRCRDLDGDADVHDISGNIEATGMSGGLTAEVQNGKVHADFRALQPGHSVAITSLNGEVVVVLPGDAKASLQLRTQNGSILTDFDERELVTTAVSARSGNRRSADARPDVRGDDGDIYSQTRIAVRESAAAVRDAARAAQEAARGAQDGLAEAGIRVPLPPIPPLPPMTGGDTIAGALHGGGTSVQITTLNGDVTVRKAQEK